VSRPLHHETAKSFTVLAPSPFADFEARVAHLRQLYAGHPAAASSQWSRKYVASEIDPVNFRADNAYVWQRFHGDDTYERSYKWLVDHEGDLLARCSEDGAFGAHCVSIDGRLISRDLLDAVAELGFLRSEFGDLSSLSILDIGAGYGRLAHRAAEVAPGVRFTCSDAIPESTALSEIYLAYRGVQTATAVPLNDIASALSRTRIDVAVNIHSFPECPPPAIEWWLRLLADHEIRYLFLVPAIVSHLRSTEGSHLELVSLLNRFGYRLEATRLKYRDRRFADTDWVFQDSHHLFVRNGLKRRFGKAS
jgi:SAM-dependent methyltransferase